MSTSAAKTILVVDDDFDIRETLSEVLREEGYVTFSAANGREALERLRTMPRPALILLDLTMPVMDGWQFRAEQMKDADLSSIPVVVLSAVGKVDGRRDDMAGADLIRKPVQLEHLLRTIATHVA